MATRVASKWRNAALKMAAENYVRAAFRVECLYMATGKDAYRSDVLQTPLEEDAFRCIYGAVMRGYQFAVQQLLYLLVADGRFEDAKKIIAERFKEPMEVMSLLSIDYRAPGMYKTADEKGLRKALLERLVKSSH